MKHVIGRITATKLGTSSPVRCRKTNGESPCWMIIWMKRSDWVSHTSATSPSVETASPMRSWRNT